MVMTKQSLSEFGELTLRHADEADSEDIWRWRNDEQTRLWSVTTERVGWDEHCRWFEQSLANEMRCLYIGIDRSGEKIGICRFDIDEQSNTAEVSINLNPLHRGKRLSVPLLSSAIAIFQAIQRIDLTATIKKANTTSIRCFTSCGFTLSSDDEEYNFYIAAAE
jgi:RimJ/RimL family protein N-acetyltransferase